MKTLPKELMKKHVALAIESGEKTLETCADNVERAAAVLLGTIRGGGKILACGNGGSAVTAQRLVTELIGGKPRTNHPAERKPLPAISLSASAPILTAISNNYGFERVFSRQVEALGKPGDALVAITTSGSSKNVVGAAQAARMKEMKVVGLTGATGGGLVPHCDACVRIPTKDAYLAQEAHMAIIAVWSEFLEANA